MVDIYRFVFILLIMAHHLYLKGKPFNSAWIYVEFFFILSGYFTMYHYSMRKDPDKTLSLEIKASEAVGYTLKKFGRMFPYILIAVFMEFTVECISTGISGERQFLNLSEQFIVESLLLSSSGLVSAHVAPIWYLSAMFLVFPLFCLLLSFKQMWKWYYQYLSWILAACFYGHVGIVSRPNDLLRAFVCLWLGVFVYGLAEKVKNIPETRLSETFFTILEIGSFTLTIICTGWNTGNNMLIILCFLSGSVALMSGKSITRYVKGIPELGTISMLCYLFHWPIKKALIFIFSPPGGVLQARMIAIYYTVTILLSIMICFVHKKWKTWEKRY